jgi:hypothetical protein
VWCVWGFGVILMLVCSCYAVVWPAKGSHVVVAQLVAQLSLHCLAAVPDRQMGNRPHQMVSLYTSQELLEWMPA